MECNRKESLTFWTSSKTGKFTIGDMRLGWRLEKTGVIFFFFGFVLFHPLLRQTRIFGMIRTFK